MIRAAAGCGRCALGALLSLGGTLATAQPAAITLAEAERRALASSTALRILALRVRAASRGYTLSLRRFLPSVSLGASSDRQVTLAAPDSSQVRWTMSLVQPLFDAGRSIAARRLSAVELAIGEREAAAQREQVVDEVRTRFVRLLVARRKLAIQEDSLESAQAQLTLARVELGLGSLREVDVLETELEAVAVELDLQETRAGLEEEEYAFKRLLGMDPGAPLALEGTVDPSYAGIVPGADSAAMQRLALEASREIDSQRLAVNRSLEELKALGRWFLPDISLQVDLALSGTRYPLQSPQASATLTVSFPWPAAPLQLTASGGSIPRTQSQASLAASVPVLEDPGAAVNVALARAAWESGALALADLEREVAFQVTVRASALERQRAALALRRRRLEMEERTTAILARQLDLGEARRLDYVRAETSLARSRAAQLESVLALQEAERAFEQLLGLPRGGLATLEDSRGAP